MPVLPLKTPKRTAMDFWLRAGVLGSQTLGIEMMKAGDLVRISRESIGVPMDTVGLLLENVKTFKRKGQTQSIWRVQLLFGGKLRERRYMCVDLEVLNETR